MLACVQSYGIVAHKLAKIQPPALGQVIIPSGYHVFFGEKLEKTRFDHFPV